MRNKIQKQIVVLEAMDYSNEYIAKRLGYCTGYIASIKSNGKISKNFRKKFESEFTYELETISNMREENKQLRKQVEDYTSRLIKITEVVYGG